jgi:hypothetical protein
LQLLQDAQFAPRTGHWSRRFPPGDSGKTSTTGSTWSASSCRRCAAAAKTFQI